MEEYIKVDHISDVLFKLHPAQMASIADIYENGDGVERNEKKALDYYTWSAMLGDPYAQSVLANAYSIGRGIKKSDEQALYWYKKSAEQGNPYAQYEVGMRITDEEGALLWLHASAKQGFSTAMKEMSDRLRRIDPGRSKRWLRRYYRKKNKIENINGKAYMRSIRKMPMPRVIGGEVVIRI